MRSSRRRIGKPPFSRNERATIVARVAGLAKQRATACSMLPIGPFWSFVGYSRADLVAHFERRHRQGCLICGQPLDERPEIVHIDPLSGATDGPSLQRLMQPENIGFGHSDCNKKLGANPLS